MKKKNKGHQNSARQTNTRVVAAGVDLPPTEVIALLGQKPDLSRPERLQLAQAFDSTGLATEALMTFLPLRGKISNEIDARIRSLLEGFVAKAESDPHFIPNLSLEELSKSALALRGVSKNQALYFAVLDRLAELSLKVDSEKDHARGAWDLLQNDCGPEIFLHLSKLRLRDFVSLKSGDPLTLSHTLLTSGAIFFLLRDSPDFNGFSHFVSLLGELLFSRHVLKASHLERLKKECEFLIDFSKDVSLKSNCASAFLLSPGHYHSLPPEARLRRLFESEVSGKRMEDTQSFYQSSVYFLVCLNLGLLADKQSETLKNWLKKKPFPLQDVSALANLSLRELGAGNPLGLEGLQKAAQLAHQDDKVLQFRWQSDAKAFRKLETKTLIDLFLLLPLHSLNESLRADLAKAALAKCSDPSVQCRFHFQLLEWIVQSPSEFSYNKFGTAHWRRLTHAQAFWKSLNENTWEKSYKVLLAGKSSIEEVKLFVESLLLAWHRFKNEDSLFAPRVEFGLIFERFYELFDSIGRKRNLLKMFPALSVFQRRRFLKSPFALALLMEHLTKHFEEHGLHIVPQGFEMSTSPRDFLQPSSDLSHPQTESLMKWEMTPFYQLDLEPNAQKSQVLKKCMDAMRKPGADLAHIRRLQAQLMHPEFSSFLNFYWSSPFKINGKVEDLVEIPMHESREIHEGRATV